MTYITVISGNLRLRRAGQAALSGHHHFGTIVTINIETHHITELTPALRGPDPVGTDRCSATLFGVESLYGLAAAMGWRILARESGLKRPLGSRRVQMARSSAMLNL